MRFSPSTFDRERYDLPETVDFDIARFTNKEADLLQAQAGVAPEQWLELLLGEIAETPEGAPIINEDTGEPRRTFPASTVSLVYWLALRRNGFDIPYAEFEYDIFGTRVIGDEDQPADGGEDEGKDQPSDPPTLM